jgi:hypothetical protein
MRSARPHDVTFARQSEKSFLSSGKAHIDVPPSVLWVIRVRKTHREGSETPARTPATSSDKLVESCVEYGAVDSPFERLVMILAEPENRTRPRGRIIGLAR